MYNKKARNPFKIKPKPIKAAKKIFETAKEVIADGVYRKKDKQSYQRYQEIANYIASKGMEEGAQPEDFEGLNIGETKDGKPVYTLDGKNWQALS